MNLRVEVLLAAYCILIVLASLAGGWLPSVIRLTHKRMQLIVSLVGGLMLGVGLFHMLPHAYYQIGSLERAMWWLMVGLLVMFFLVRTLHFHQHEPPELSENADDHQHHDHEHDHDNDGHGHAHHHHQSSHRLSWIGVAAGLALHTLIDGIALAASVQAEAAHADVTLVGLGTFLAILLHKPLDAVSITSLMAAGGWSATSRNLVNAGFASMCPLGAAFFVLGVNRFVENQHVVVGCALAFSAGVFVCISLGDLLPEIEFHSHDRLKLSAALLLGVAVAYAIGLLESDHMHSHAHDAHAEPDSDVPADREHSHDEHDHGHEH